MARKVKELKINEFYYLSKEFKENENFNEIDWSVAEFLFSLEATRQGKIKCGKEALSYNYASISTICERTGILAPQTVRKSIAKLVYFDVIKVNKNQEDVNQRKGLSNRYYINDNWMNKGKITDEKIIENNSITDDNVSRIESMFAELLRQNQELKNEIKELRKEISQLKNDDNISSEPVNNIVPVQETIIPNDEPAIDEEVNESLFLTTDEIINELVNESISEPVNEYDIEPLEEVTIFENNNSENVNVIGSDEWEDKMTEQYKTNCYTSNKKISHLKSAKEIKNEIEFRKIYNKPLYDLPIRLEMADKLTMNNLF